METQGGRECESYEDGGDGEEEEELVIEGRHWCGRWRDGVVLRFR